MSFAIQCLQESIIGCGGYVSETDIHSRIKSVTFDIILEAINELIHKGLLSKEFYEGKGHKVLGKFVDKSNAFMVNPDIKNDTYDESYVIRIYQSFIYENNKKHTVLGFKQIYAGSHESCKKHTKELVKIFKTEETDFPIVNYRISKAK